jgi:hypothetical protein
MIQLKNYADKRQTSLCAYCGEYKTKFTRDHTPSKVFLNKPYPNNLYVLSACFTCNNNFSFDEEYVAYWIAIALYKLNGIETNNYLKAIRAIERNEKLKKLFFGASLFVEDDLVPIDERRLENILYKLSSGHILYHQNNPKYELPATINWFFLSSLSNSQRYAYEQEILVDVYPEVGSRTIMVMDQHGNTYYPWIVTQEGVYRYLVAETENLQVVKIVFNEFLACEVLWNES